MTERECGFVNIPLLTPEEARANNIRPYNSIPSDKMEKFEFKDYLDGFDVMLLEKGTVLCHSTSKSIRNEENVWWNRSYPGQKNFKGGWFTYETDYGGPHFGLNLFYKLQEDVAVLYIPNMRLKLDDPSYFVDFVEMWMDKSFNSSHIIQGPKDWKKKGYKNLKDNNYFADGLSYRLAELGFNGYITCDECEVFITHDKMETAITYPFDIQLDATLAEMHRYSAKDIKELSNKRKEEYNQFSKKRLKVTEDVEKR